MAKKKTETKSKFSVGERVRYQSSITHTCGTGVIVGHNFISDYDIITIDGEWDTAPEDMCESIGAGQDSLERGSFIKKAILKDLEIIINSQQSTPQKICESNSIPIYRVNNFPEHCTLEINDFFQILAALGYSIKLEPNKTVSSITNNITKPSYKIGDIVEYNDCDELKTGKVIDIISDSIIGNIGIIKGKDGYNFYDVGAKAKVK